MSWLQNNVILPFIEPDRHKGLGGRLRKLEAFESLPSHEQRAEQARRVQAILQHAYETVPYYRNAFDSAGTTPADWRMGDPLPVPCTSRETIREFGDAMLSNKFPRESLHTAMTGGTTSTPVLLYRDTNGLRDKIALQYHLNRWMGYDQGDKVMMVWGAERDLEMNPSWRWKFYEQYLKGQIPAPAGQISDEVFELFMARLNKTRPKVLFGYSVTITSFARFLLKHGNGRYHTPEAVIITAEPVTPEDKVIIREAFRCPVTEQYGSREAGMIATECEHHQGLHFHPAGCFPEFEYHSTSSEGPLYRLIITDLMNYGMPLIRYDTGDCVILEEGECPCGRWYPRVKSVMGRIMDTLILPDGSEVPGLTVANQIIGLTHNFRFVTKIQVIQKTINHIQLRYVSSGTDAETEGELTRVRAALERVFRLPIKVEMVRVDDIPRAASGKLRLCISEVPRESGSPEAAAELSPAV